MDNLEEFLSGNAPVETVEAVEAPEASEAVVTEEAEAPKSERPRGPDGKFIPKGEPAEPAEGASPAPTEPQIDHPALIGERRRRQEAEQRIAEYEARLAQLQQPQPQDQPQSLQPAPNYHPKFGPRPDQWEDSDAARAWDRAVDREELREEVRAEAYGQFQYQRISTAAAQFAPSVPDYADKVQVFQQMVAVNPHLLQELYRAPNPAEYAYNTAKTQIEISQFGGIEGLIKARVEDALKSQPASTAQPIPDTLADAQSARGSSTTLTVPTLDEILKR